MICALTVSDCPIRWFCSLFSKPKCLLCDDDNQRYNRILHWILFLPSVDFVSPNNCRWKQNQFVIRLGLFVTLIGIVLRAGAEIQMGSNFTHLIRTEHVNSHELVTSGIYSLFRHPSYTGWFYYCVGSELILCNPICVLISALVNWGLLYFRIPWGSECFCDE